MDKLLRVKVLIPPIILLSCLLLLTGCGDLIEIQNRDFVLAIGISYENEQYRISYGLPDPDSINGSSSAVRQSSQIRVHTGKSLPEIGQSYNMASENHLDYRHLQVIILSDSICSQPGRMRDLLAQLNDNYDISHNVLVYYCKTDVHELMKAKETGGSIGDYLKKLNNNNHAGTTEPMNIGTLISCMENTRTLYIPALLCQDHVISLDGGIFFCGNQKLRHISQEDSDFFLLSLGKSKQILVRFSEDRLIQIKDARVKLRYRLTGQTPDINLHLTGTAKALAGNGYSENNFHAKEQMDAYFRTRIEDQLTEFMKQDQIDYLNFYDKSSYLSRPVWLLYENRLDDFIREAAVTVTVDIDYGFPFSIP